MNSRRIVLASGSTYRAELLGRLVPKFDTEVPNIDEASVPEESAVEQVQRLSIAKAQAVRCRYPEAIIIGSDQIALTADGRRLGKPGTAEDAVQQLHSISGQTVQFLTGLCVLDGASGRYLYRQVETAVHLRTLGLGEIERYVARERPLDCAASFKAEGLGIALFEWIRSDDPTALIGLPLIATATLLRQAGFEVLA